MEQLFSQEIDVLLSLGLIPFPSFWWGRALWAAKFPQYETEVMALKCRLWLRGIIPEGPEHFPWVNREWNPSVLEHSHAKLFIFINLHGNVFSQSNVRYLETKPSTVHSFTHFSWIKTIYLLCSIFHLHFSPLNDKKHTFSILLGNLKSHGLLQFTLFNISCFAASQVGDRFSSPQCGTRQH